jgi:hypothetical protein
MQDNFIYNHRREFFPNVNWDSVDNSCITPKDFTKKFTNSDLYIQSLHDHRKQLLTDILNKANNAMDVIYDILTTEFKNKIFYIKDSDKFYSIQPLCSIQSLCSSNHCDPNNNIKEVDYYNDIHPNVVKILSNFISNIIEYYPDYQYYNYHALYHQSSHKYYSDDSSSDEYNSDDSSSDESVETTESIKDNIYYKIYKLDDIRKQTCGMLTTKKWMMELLTISNSH